MKLSLITICFVALLTLSLASGDEIAAKGPTSGGQILGISQYIMPIYQNLFILDLADAQPTYEDCHESLTRCREQFNGVYNTSDPCGAYNHCLAAEMCNIMFATCNCKKVNSPGDQEAIDRCVEANSHDCGDPPEGC